jgi:hypothetical protein
MIKKGFMIAAGVLCFTVAGYLIYRMVQPSGDYEAQLPPVRMRLAEKLVPRAVGDMRGRLPSTYFGAVLLQFKGHRNAHDLRKLVEDEIVDNKILRLKNLEEVAEEKKESMGWLVKGKTFLQDWASTMGIAAPQDPGDEVKAALRSAKIDGFVGGKVDFLENSSSEERLELTLYATDVEGKEVFRETYKETIARSLADLEYYRIKLGEIGVFWRLLFWIVFTLALPVATFFLPVRAMKTESNGVIFGTLAAYTAADILAALAVMGFAISGVLSFFALVVGAVLAAVYNYGMFTEIKDLT